ncbi:MAG: hypothetical protein BWZ00_01136 [Bacteroidetes bacterium ADurb.BinA174]|nr:MAG: hypothetical protein BWZ00_01136 [Bacteroidetes bacterium ADurb.BinA174]
MYVFVGNCKNYAIMGVLKFTIKISENNTIQLPKNSTFINKKVDIILIPKTKQGKKW